MDKISSIVDKGEAAEVIDETFHTGREVPIIIVIPGGG